MTAEHPSDDDAAHDRDRIAVLKSARQQALLSILAESDRPLSTKDLSELTNQTLGATAHHVRGLARGGFIAWAGERRTRGALQTFYVVSEPGRLALRQPRVDALLTLAGSGGTARSGRSPFTNLDDIAIDELVRVAEELKPRLVDIARRAEARRTREP